MSVRKAQTERKVNSERKMNDLFVKQVIARIILLLCSGLYLSTACTPTFIIKFKVIGLNSTKSILSVIADTKNSNLGDKMRKTDL